MSHKVLRLPNCPKVIFSSGRTVVPITEWLIQRKFSDLFNDKTVRANAAHLAHWLDYCESEKIDYLIDPTTLTVQRYRDESLVELSNENCNLYLTSICHFYWWCQNNTSYCSNMIGWPNKNTDIDFNIIVKKSSKGSSGFGIPFLKATIQKTMKYIPKAHEVRLLNDYLSKEIENQAGSAGLFLAIRNQLMVRWVTEAGLRAEEIVSLHVSDLPKLSEMNSYLVKVLIHRGTKYGKRRNVEVTASLVKATWDYIEYERGEIIDELWANHRDIENVFINGGNKSKSAKMDQKTFYSLLTSFNPRLNPHALRRFALTRYAARLIRVERNIRRKSNDLKQIDVMHVEQALRLQAGHQSITTTIKWYVNYALAIDLSKEEMELMSIRIEELEWELEMLKSRHNESIDLREFT
ncbi:hypothetical protein MED121_19961 [Marinomonas sp. MED121]|uniref:site-specific integrase n=1 Tax=Marinomonas sp. MED121 TaxID=314277 RepID=UPI0000691246|nr:site-specific integrase [Marinomonas sp. MED121]EAQ63525.1 hypothetical protein MED121_19961 [Marinomonas sp. MED121]